MTVLTQSNQLAQNSTSLQNISLVQVVLTNPIIVVSIIGTTSVNDQTSRTTMTLLVPIIVSITTIPTTSLLTRIGSKCLVIIVPIRSLGLYSNSVGTAQVYSISLRQIAKNILPLVLYSLSRVQYRPRQFQIYDYD